MTRNVLKAVINNNMEDAERKEELSKEVLAPPDSVRDELVATAVKFLQNPKVAQSAFSQKKAFLQRKGLTEEEIKLAVERSGTKETTTTIQTTDDPVSPSSQLSVAQPPPLPLRASEVAVSRWTKAREVLVVVTMVTGISYAAHRLYLEFLRPWLFGAPSTGKRLDELEKLLKKSVEETSQSLTTIDDKLSQQQEKLQILSHDVNSRTGGEGMTVLHNNQSIGDIKTELSTIKGLLLNRRQFPPVPQSMPVLPSWQLASNAGDANSNNKGSDTSTGPSPTPVSFSSSPTPTGTDDVPMATEDGDVTIATADSETKLTSSNDDEDLSVTAAGGDNEDMRVDGDLDLDCSCKGEGQRSSAGSDGEEEEEQEEG